jgi:hypothetical protein
MSDNAGSYPPQYPDPQPPSTTDVAREQAANVGQSVSDAGSHVAQTATDQARQVAAETARQARDLMGEATGQVRDQASVQQQRAAHQLHSVADELHEMVAKGGQSGLATEVAQQTADRLHGAASWLERREPGDLLTSVRDFARRRPGMFLAGAAIAGLAAGRLTRGITAASHSDDEPQGAQRGIASAGTPGVPTPRVPTPGLAEPTPGLAEPTFTPNEAAYEPTSGLTAAQEPASGYQSTAYRSTGYQDPAYQAGTSQGPAVGLPVQGGAYAEGAYAEDSAAPPVPGYVAGSYPEDEGVPEAPAYPQSGGYPQGRLNPDNGEGWTSEDEPRRP